METVGLRYFNVFGPRQDPSSPYSGVISLFISALVEGRTAPIHGDGEQTRDFTYVANVVDGVLRACDAQGARGGVFNVATGGRISLNALFQTLKRITGASGEPAYGPPRAGDVRDSQADFARARQVLGYEPTVDFEDGLRRTVPATDKFLVVDDAKWGMDVSTTRKPIPFLERDGVHWGAPADDATAIRELERMRQAGAAYIVFGWPSFWWLDHFQQFAQHLYTNYRRVLQNERLMVFDLRGER